MIVTNRLIIRKFLRTDYRDLHEYLSLKEVYKYEPGKPIVLKKAKELSLSRSRGNDFYAVELIEEKKLIGHIYFQQVEPKKMLTWEVGYIFNPKYHKNGYASESVKALVEFGFKNFKIHKVIGYCNPENISSWKVLENIGMVREGMLRKNIYFNNDENNKPIWIDTYQYGLLEEDRRASSAK